MFKGASFGITNGIITILSILVGMYSVNASKLSVIGAFLAILISDPLSDAYAIYIAEKERHDKAFDVFKHAFSSQFILQLIYLTIIILSPTVKSAVIYSFIFSIISLLGYTYYKSLSLSDLLQNMIGISILVIVTYTINQLVYKYYNKK
tara:strand:- start:2446 stop:2892 length:447 start_codon:yes stop_codon:yes gene_type:complete